MRSRSLVPACVAIHIAVLAACSAPTHEPPSGDAGADATTSTDVPLVPVGCEPLATVASEGSSGAPVDWPLASLPSTGRVNHDDGPSHYRISGLIVGARYRMTFAGGVAGSYDVFQTADLAKAICANASSWWEGAADCIFVPQATTVDLRVTQTSTEDENACFALSIALDAPPLAFEGATDRLHELRFGTDDLPHLGLVDHRTSYYRITELAPGHRYVAYVTSPRTVLSLLFGTEDALTGLTNDHTTGSGAANTFSNVVEDRYFTFTASGTTQAFAIDQDYTSGSGSRYVIAVFEDFEPLGSSASPVVIPYAGGVSIEGHVGRTETVGVSSKSYYTITGVTPGTHYLVGLADSATVDLVPFTDATFSQAVTCFNSGQPYCDLTATGTSLYLTAIGGGAHSQFYRLEVHPMATDEGTSGSPIALAYPGSFPRTVQASFSSYYRISGLPSGTIELSYTNQQGTLGFGAFPTGDATGSCNAGSNHAHCLVSPNASGEVDVRVNYVPSRFDLIVRPAPALMATHTHVAGRVAIPNGDATGLFDTIVVAGSSVTSITRARVEVHVDHGYPSDLVAYLVAPDGTVVQLSKKMQSPYDGITFSDFALDPLAGWNRDGVTERRPVMPLHMLTGMDANGTWTLHLVDDADPNISDNDGELLGWGITLE